MPSLTVHYTLHPPPSTPHPHSLKPDTVLTFDVPPLATSTSSSDGASGGEKPDLDAYYANLKDAVSRAKERLGEDLTAWRDAVGRAEEGKEKKIGKGKKVESEEEGEEEEENEE